MLKLPDRYNYAEAFLTFRCDFGCSYCINKAGALQPREEMSAEQWANAINSIEWGIPLTLGGGEPTLHKEFYELLDLIKPEVDLELLTSLSFNVNEFVLKTNPDRFTKGRGAYKSIRVSYHPTQHDPEDLVKKAKVLQNRGYKIGIFGLNYPDNCEANIEMAEIARKEGIYFFIKDFLGEYDDKLFGHYKYPDAIDRLHRTVSCESSELLIAPDGKIHRCHRFLYANDGPMGTLDKLEEIDATGKRCAHYGSCNPCDVKLKTNRFLQMGNCSVTVKDPTVMDF
jgi:MoaA/NifB/PqqE/SkfB family radical SAM enzyme